MNQHGIFWNLELSLNFKYNEVIASQIMWHSVPNHVALIVNLSVASENLVVTLCTLSTESQNE